VDKILQLKPGRERSVQQRHPWIYSGAIDHVRGGPDCGDTVQIHDSGGTYLATGSFSPKSQIRSRVWTWDANDLIDKNYFQSKMDQATRMRKVLIDASITDAVRLVHGESDCLPGLIIDQYAEVLVIQVLSCGAERWRDTIVSILAERIKPAMIFERSDVAVRKLEGLNARAGLLWGTEPAKPIGIVENGLNFIVDCINGHKTGFYIDQRANRQIVRSYADRKDVLDCFCYSGGFTVSALAGGANSVTAVDSSSSAIEMLKQNVDINNLDQNKLATINGDVFQVLRTMRDSRKTFDLIILDPPKFAPTSTQVARATRAYKDINLLALKLLRPGGILATFSCSGGVSSELFQKIVAGAALDAGVYVKVIRKLFQSSDHPIALNFLEGGYLKGILAIKD
jgi:23S rRNA (cytosine1962-C5)-methyltransferase